MKAIDLTGQKFGRWVVTQSIDLTGHKFGRLVVVKSASIRIRPNGKKRYYWLCRCMCASATEVEIETSALRSGVRKSCGCLHLEHTPVLDRILSRLVYDYGCWMWTGGTTTAGYATIKVEGSKGKDYVHRVMYEIERGAIPPRLEIDHLCRNTVCCNPLHLEVCCNPLHLEAVTRVENIIRGTGPALTSARAKLKAHCLRGHKLAGANLYVKPNGDRVCRTCQDARRHAAHVAR